MMWLIYLILIAVVIFFLYRYISARAAGQTDAPSSPVGSSTEPAGAVQSQTGAPGAAPLAAASTAATQGLPGRDGGTGEETLDASLRQRAESYGVNTGDARRDIREAIKILNLRDSDAPRLGIEPSTFHALAAGEAANLPTDELQRIEGRLYRMLS